MAKRGRPVGTYKGQYPCVVNGKRTKLYSVWGNMMRRCTSPSDPHWKYYGARGIGVCKRWHDFQAFAADMGEPADGMTLERVDNAKGYSPANCRWATMKEQCANRRHPKPHNVDSLRQKALRAGVAYHVVYLRIKRLGWSEADALRVPVMSRGRPFAAFANPPA